MSQKSIKVFIGEICSKPPKETHSKNKFDVHHINDIWSLDILEIKGYGP